MDVEVCIGGGKTMVLKAGDQLEFSISQIEVKLGLEGGDTLENVRNALYIGRRQSRITDDETMTELRDWANADDRTFVIKAIRKFRLFWTYSTALRGLFFDMVHYYESLVKELLISLGHPEMYDELLVEYAEEKTKSSSPVLYGFGKYEPLNVLLNGQLLLTHITNAEMWSYPGFCPFVSTDRFAKLCRFPVDLILGILNKHDTTGPNFNAIATEKLIVAPQLPALDSFDSLVVVEDSPIKFGQIILDRLKKHEKIIHSWELYYIECAKQVGRIDKQLFSKN
mgnify:CR=1 FL=1